MITILPSVLRREPVVGLDIRNGLISAALVSGTLHERPVLHQVVCAPYDPAGGDAAISATLRSMWRRSRFSTYSVCSCLHTFTLFTKAFCLRHVDPSELADVLMLEAEQALSLAPDRIALDWTVHKGRAERAVTEGVLIAAPKASVDQHLLILRRAGLYPVILDAPGMALANLYRAVTDSANTASITVVALDDASAECVTLDPEGFLFPRSLHWGGRPWIEDPDNLAREIADTIRYTTFTLRKAPVERITLSGSTQGIDALSSSLEAKTGLPVNSWDPLSRFELTSAARRSVRRMDSAAIRRTAVCLGLALRETSNGEI